MAHYANAHELSTNDGHLLLFEHILNGVALAQREEYVKRQFPRVYAYVAASRGLFNPMGGARLSSGRTLGAVSDE